MLYLPRGLLISTSGRSTIGASFSWVRRLWEDRTFLLGYGLEEVG